MFGAQELLSPTRAVYALLSSIWQLLLRVASHLEAHAGLPLEAPRDPSPPRPFEVRSETLVGGEALAQLSQDGQRERASPPEQSQSLLPAGRA